MTLHLTFLVLFSVLLGINSATYQSVFKSTKSESDLRRHLFQNYDKLVRPVKDGGKEVRVSVGLAPIYVRELEEENNFLLLDAWVAMKWTDEYMIWDPSHFGNITILRVPSTELWRPDVALYGAITDTDLFPNPRVNALIYNSGQVVWVPMFTVRSRCPVVKSKKVITCNMKFGSWTFSELELNIQLDERKADLSNFFDFNPDWKLMEVQSNRVATHYPCCKEAYPVINFNMTLKRRNDRPMESNEILQEETPMKLQDFTVSDISDIDKLLGNF